MQVSSAALACHFFSEAMLAQVAVERGEYPDGAIRINSNENPLGPCQAAREAVAKVTPEGGRYEFSLTERLVKSFAEQQGLKKEYILPLAGSTPALNFAVGTFTSAKASYVAGEPSYDAVAHCAQAMGARVVGVPLTKTWSHDVRGMIAAAPDAGAFYVCTPNNPTGTLTSHDDVEYLLDHKPKASVVVVDEAYIHFSDAPSCIDLVKADKDIIVMRTFSKLYGMAGLRCGFAIARPDLLKRMTTYGGWNPMPITACAAAQASLVQPNLIAERKASNAAVRQATFGWLDSNGYQYTPSVSNCFMLNAGKPARDVIAAMAQQKVFIGRPWPSMPEWVRITVGTQAEMEQFQTAFLNIMKGKVVGRNYDPLLERNLDGVIRPA